MISFDTNFDRQTNYSHLQSKYFKQIKFPLYESFLEILSFEAIFTIIKAVSVKATLKSEEKHCIAQDFN